MSYYIRECNEGDIPKLVSLERQCFPDPWTEEMFESEFDNPLTKYYVAVLETDVIDEVIIGYIGFLTVADECQINNVAVHPDHRRQEIASELLELVINETEDEGVNFWTLEVRVGNVPALKLYERFGFKQVGLRPYYYEDGAGALLMTKETPSEGDNTEDFDGELS